MAPSPRWALARRPLIQAAARLWVPAVPQELLSLVLLAARDLALTATATAPTDLEPTRSANLAALLVIGKVAFLVLGPTATCTAAATRPTT